MSVVLHNAGLNRLLRDEEGSVGVYIALKAIGVTEKAFARSTDRPGPRIRTRDLRLHLRFAGIFDDGSELFALVGTDAKHDGIAYPRLIEKGGVTPQGVYYRYPFLEPALAEEFGQSFKGG